MPRLSIIYLPALVVLSACSPAPGNGTSRSDSDTARDDDGAMAAPDTAAATHGSNVANVPASMGANKENSGAAGTSSDNGQGMMSDGTNPPAGSVSETRTPDMGGKGAAPPPPSK